jgi:hypothetical protein
MHVLYEQTTKNKANVLVMAESKGATAQVRLHVAVPMCISGNGSMARALALVGESLVASSKRWRLIYSMVSVAIMHPYPRWSSTKDVLLVSKHYPDHGVGKNTKATANQNKCTP